jgi:hypothetical protein
MCTRIDVVIYRRIGSVHSGYNLIGEHPDLAADYIAWRKYRIGMVLAARAFSPELVCTACLERRANGSPSCGVVQAMGRESRFSREHIDETEGPTVAWGIFGI